MNDCVADALLRNTIVNYSFNANVSLKEISDMYKRLLPNIQIVVALVSPGEWRKRTNLRQYLKEIELFRLHFPAIQQNSNSAASSTHLPHEIYKSVLIPLPFLPQLLCRGVLLATQFQS